MGFHMKTTLEIPDHLMRALKERAARDGTTMSELVEAALRTLLEETPAAKELPPLPTWNSGGLLVNIDSRAEWYDQIEDDEEGDDVRR
jgi:hypothetical protein